MSELAKKKCIPCSGDIPALKDNEISELKKELKNWEIKKTIDGYNCLNKNIKFDNFLESLNFINKVSKVAEEENHHPDLKFGWGYADITIFTHAIKGLTEGDFVLAAKIDEIN